jgi:hypothetical protein
LPIFIRWASKFLLFNPTLNPNLHPMFGDPKALLTMNLPGAYRVKVLD